MRIKVKVKTQPPDLLARLYRSPAAKNIIDSMVKDLAYRLANRAKRNAPYATGALRRSIVPHRIKSGRWEVPAVGSEKKPYAAYMELGTRPHWPPRDAIEDWVRIKLGVREPKAIERTAFLVSRAIATRGTKPRYFMKQAFEKTAKEASSVAKKWIQTLIKTFGK